MGTKDARECMKLSLRGKYHVSEHAVELRKIISVLPIGRSGGSSVAGVFGYGTRAEHIDVCAL